jgi:hypothetical protein
MSESRDNAKGASPAAASPSSAGAPPATGPLGHAVRGFQTDSFILKAIAIVGMTANHAGHVFAAWLPAPAHIALVGIGGLTFPIMAFLLAVGYQHTRDVGRYAQRLGVFALLSLLPFFWALGDKLNVMFTLLMGLGVIWADDHIDSRPAFYALLAAAMIASHWCDWSYIGVPMIWLYHRGRGKPWGAVAPIAMPWLWGLSELLAAIGLGLWQGYWHQLLPNLLYCFAGASLTIPLVRLYGGSRGRPLKYFFYAYYPGHLVLLALARGLLYGVWWA